MDKNVKDVIEVVGVFANVAIAAVATAPALRRAYWLLTTEPELSAAKRTERIELLVSNRMGAFEKAWNFFLDWCRNTTDETLSWRERRYRYFWCRINTHIITEMLPAGSNGRFQGTCVNCQATSPATTKDGVRLFAEKGELPPNTTTRSRRFHPPATAPK
jgi:hypothetical protein